MITPDSLSAAGFRPVGKHPGHPYSDHAWQFKAVTPFGIQFFCDLIHYPKSALDQLPESWMMEVRSQRPLYTFRAHNVDDAEECIRIARKFWLLMECEYYEIFQPVIENN